MNRSIKLHYGSHTGLVRAKNEDSLCVGDITVTAGHTASINSLEIEFTSGLWLAVADGLGGHGSGDTASAVAVQALVETARTATQAVDIEQVADRIQTQLQSRARAGDVSGSMGTTLSALYWNSDGITVLHIGDSRIYTIPDFQQITRDDTAIQELIEKGEIPETMRNVHPLKNRLTRCFVASGKTPEVFSHRMRHANDQGFLLCSDGLWENFQAEEMKEQLQTMLNRKEDFHAFATYLLNTALDRGGKDNISFILVEPAQSRSDLR